jgi:hypothetical protein
MKQITQLSEQEILQLTDDQLSNMVKYKMAESGIKILDYPEQPTYGLMPAKDWTLFKVEGIDKLFINKEDAEAVSKLLSEMKDNVALAENAYIGYDSVTQHAKAFSAEHYAFPGFAIVKETPLYREKTINGVKDIIESNKALKTKYETELKEYKEADTASSDIKAMIYGTYNDVMAKYQKMADMQYKYQQYVKLADGNEETAMKFLKNAYTIDEQTEYYVQGKEMPETVTQSEPIIE